MPRRRNLNRRYKEERERKYRLRSRTHRFIPPKDSDFAYMSRKFASHVVEHAERLEVPAEKMEELRAAAAVFREALCRSLYHRTAGPKATSEKNDARKHAEKVVRATARYLRGAVEEKLTGIDRLMLNMPERPKRAKRLECPQVAPELRFVGAVGPHGTQVHVGNAVRHILEYGNDFDHSSSAKPHGAARLELFVELVPVGEPIPSHPAERSGGRLWYVRSYTTSRFEVTFPVMDDGTPMLVCYWGRWADSSGGVGPFSQTCVARVEGAAEMALGRAASALPGLPGAQSERIRVTQVMKQLEANVVVMPARALLQDAEAVSNRNLLDAA